VPPEEPEHPSGIGPVLAGAAGERYSNTVRIARRALVDRFRKEGRREGLILALCSAMTALSAAGFAWGSAMLLSAVIGGVVPSTDPQWWALLVLGSLLGRVGSQSLRSAVAGRLGARMRRRWQEDWIDAPLGKAGDDLRRQLSSLIEGTARIELWYARFLPAGIHLAVAAPLLLLLVLWIDPLSGLVLLIGGPLIPVFMVLIGLMAQDRIHRQWRQLQRLQERFRGLLWGFEDLQLLGRADPERSGVVRLSGEFRRATMRVLLIAFLSGFVLEFFAMIGTALVAVQAGIRLVEGHLIFSTAWVVLLLTPEYFLTFRQLGLNHHAGMEGAEAAADLMRPPPRPGESEPATGPAGDEGPGPAAREGGGLSADDLWFAHPGGVELFHGLSFALPVGARLAVTGPSGCGKSTLVRILLGLVPCHRGTLSWEGEVLSPSDPGRWRDCFSWVPQHPAFFSGTLRHNLCMGEAETASGDCERALVSAGLGDWFKNLPRGLDTGIGEAARNLSEGQRQRLAIARALVANTPVLILDEPSAALDPESEAHLSATMDRLRGRKTLIVITHRQRTAKGASHRLRFADGWRFEEEGGGG